MFNLVFMRIRIVLSDSKTPNLFLGNIPPQEPHLNLVVYKRTQITRTLKILKWLSPTPLIAECTCCGRQFIVPLVALISTRAAQTNLQAHFDKHICKKRYVAA